jgi:hypothetical protein
LKRKGREELPAKNAKKFVWGLLRKFLLVADSTISQRIIEFYQGWQEGDELK